MGYNIWKLKTHKITKKSMFPPRRKTFDTNPDSLILNTEVLFPSTCVPLYGGSCFS